LEEGDKCQADKNYITKFNIACNTHMKHGQLNCTNLEDITLAKCENTLQCESNEGCVKLNYYLVTAFLNQYKIFFGGFIIVVGFFLIIFGAKFIKVTVFVVGTLSTITVIFLIAFNIFHPDSNTTVWIVLIVGAVIGLVL